MLATQVVSGDANETLLDALALRVLGSLAEGHAHVFALKVPRFTYSQTYRLMARLRGACDPGVPCTQQALHRFLEPSAVWSRRLLHLGFARGVEPLS